jgi:bacillolysin
MTEPTSKQKKAFEKLKEIDAEVDIRWDQKTGAPARLMGALSPPQMGDPIQIAKNFLSGQSEMFSMMAAEEEFQPKEMNVDEQGNQHVRFKQEYKGIPVFGREVIVHLNEENAVTGVNGRVMRSSMVDLAEETKLKAKDAIEIALKDDAENKEVPSSEPRLEVLFHEEKPFITWHVTVKGNELSLRNVKESTLWEYFIDANTGKVIWRYNNMQTHSITQGTGAGLYSGSGPLNIFHEHSTNKYQLIDRTLPGGARVLTYDNASISEDVDANFNASNQRELVDCHRFSRTVFDYFYVNHGRNSFNNAGKDMKIVYYRDNHENNAGWNGQYVKIYAGDGKGYGPFCTLDIVAHEWTHAVTQYTANLIYDSESGALNESMSDVFAALVDGDWLQGEDNWKNLAEAPAGRNLADPTNGGKYKPSDPINSVLKGHQPDHMNDKYTGAVDGHGVHINSGIMNKVAYLIATGGNHRGIKICTPLGRTVLGKLYYQALTNHLVPSSGFNSMRDAVLASLDDLYRNNSSYSVWKASIINAFAAIGIGNAINCPTICILAPRVCPSAPKIICPPAARICTLAPCPPSPV